MVEELTGQVKYNKSDVKEVDTSEIVDFSIARNEPVKDDSKKNSEVLFKNPFNVPDYVSEKNEKSASIAEQDMKELIRGIREFGVLVPLLVRKREDGKYELLSGYRRKKAVEIINQDRPENEKIKVPIIEVSDCDDDKAIVVLTTSNTHRSKITMTEQIKACGFAYRAMCHRGKSSQDGKNTADVIGEIFNLPPEKVRRYSTLVNLNDELLTIIGGEDNKKKGTRCRNIDGKLKLSVRAGESLSRLSKSQQEIVLQFLNDEENKNVITVALANWICKKFKKNPELDLKELREAIEELEKSEKTGSLERSETKKVEIIFDDLQAYFPNKTAQEISDRIHFFLEKWRAAGSPEDFEIR